MKLLLPILLLLSSPMALSHEKKRCYKRKKCHRHYIVKRRHKRKKFSLSMLGGVSKTRLHTNFEEEHYDNHQVHLESEFDKGIMLQYDPTRSIRFSIIGTSNGSGYLGIGFNF